MIDLNRQTIFFIKDIRDYYPIVKIHKESIKAQKYNKLIKYLL